MTWLHFYLPSKRPSYKYIRLHTTGASIPKSSRKGSTAVVGILYISMIVNIRTYKNNMVDRRVFLSLLGNKNRDTNRVKEAIILFK